MASVRHYMQEKSLNISQLSRAMGLSTSYVWRVLNGQKGPGIGFIRGLLRAGLPPEAILDVTSGKDEVSENEQRAQTV